MQQGPLHSFVFLCSREQRSQGRYSRSLCFRVPTKKKGSVKQKGSLQSVFFYPTASCLTTTHSGISDIIRHKQLPDRQAMAMQVWEKNPRKLVCSQWSPHSLAVSCWSTAGGSYSYSFILPWIPCVSVTKEFPMERGPRVSQMPLTTTIPPGWNLSL